MTTNFLSAAPGVSAPPRERDLRVDNVQIPERLGNLPPLNAIANQVLALAANPDVDLQQVAKVMEGDPAFAADVLLLANSPLFGFRSRIQAVRHATAALGLDRIKALAITVGMRGYLSGGGPLLPRCWQHSAACAIIAEELSHIFDVKGDVAYTLGLLHDIGRLGLLKSYPAEYAKVLGCSFRDAEEVVAVERTLLKVDHGLAGAWMVKTWNYPAIFIETCERHHEAISPSDSGLLQTVKISCRLAEVIGHSVVNYGALIGYNEVIKALPPHVPQNRFPSGPELCKNVEKRLKGLTEMRR